MKLLKKWIIGLIILLILSNLVCATSMAPFPSCDINGEILNITHLPERYVKYVENQPMRSCDAEGDTYYPANYLLKIRINNVSNNYNEFGSCINMYPIGEIREYTITEDNYNKYPKEINDVGSWKVDCGGDECSGGCFISDINITSNVDNIRERPQTLFSKIIFYFKLLFRLE